MKNYWHVCDILQRLAYNLFNKVKSEEITFFSHSLRDRSFLV